SEFLDFNARRLVESAGHIIMGYLLLLGANDEPELFRRSAEVYIHYGQNEVIKNYNFVTKFRIENMGYYKPDLEK
ncbi:MAG: Acyl-CoA dehydrogenase C-terminal domain-containing protein, partial [Bacilli bacterium]|nr:Acyl-CoA dehydrogenase C-terminal domain-containing protein [Bacilli bacterium]